MDDNLLHPIVINIHLPLPIHIFLVLVFTNYTHIESLFGGKDRLSSSLLNCYFLWSAAAVLLRCPER